MTIALAGLFDLSASAFEPEAAIAALAHAPPLRDVGTAKWMVYTDGLAQFAGRWGKPAQACGWQPLALYGLHPIKPYANLACMGAAWVVALTGHHVLGVDTVSMELKTVAGSRLQILRRAPDPAVVLAWEMADAKPGGTVEAPRPGR